MSDTQLGARVSHAEAALRASDAAVVPNLSEGATTAQIENTAALDAIRNIPQQGQAQYSLQEQLMELRFAAIKLGLYDADDWLLRRLNS